MPAFIPLHIRETQINTVAISNNYEFVRWVDNYTGCFSRIVVRCQYHGEWDVTVTNFVNRKTRCMKCVTGTAIERATQLSHVASKKGYKFVGFVGVYRNKRNRALFECPTHGLWEGIIGNFLNTDGKCPGCVQAGYSVFRSGTLYALTSNCGSMVKIGISNVPDFRHDVLRRETPFKFSVHRQIHCDDGSIPPMLERLFHGAFPSAGLRGFDGATEWRLWHDDVNTWFDLLGG